MTDKYILDESGNPQKCNDLMKWAQWFEKSAKERRIKRSVLSTGTKISTVFLGLNHGWEPGEILLFETMVFGGPCDGDQERYSTMTEALKGHEKVVSEVMMKENLNPA